MILSKEQQEAINKLTNWQRNKAGILCKGNWRSLTVEMLEQFRQLKDAHKNMTSAREILHLSGKNIPHDIKDALVEKFAKAVCKMYDPYDVLTCWDNRDDPTYGARWKTIVMLGKLKLTGHYDQKIIHDATFEID